MGYGDILPYEHPGEQLKLTPCCVIHCCPQLWWGGSR